MYCNVLQYLQYITIYCNKQYVDIFIRRIVLYCSNEYWNISIYYCNIVTSLLATLVCTQLLIHEAPDLGHRIYTEAHDSKYQYHHTPYLVAQSKLDNVTDLVILDDM